MQFDVKPKSGRWVQPSRDKVEFWEATPSPDDDVEVHIRPIESKKTERKWTFMLSDLDKPITLSQEDLPLKGWQEIHAVLVPRAGAWYLLWLQKREAVHAYYQAHFGAFQFDSFHCKLGRLH
jgi:hypothetical protein